MVVNKFPRVVVAAAFTNPEITTESSSPSPAKVRTALGRISCTAAASLKSAAMCTTRQEDVLSNSCNSFATDFPFSADRDTNTNPAAPQACNCCAMANPSP